MNGLWLWQNAITRKVIGLNGGFIECQELAVPGSSSDYESQGSAVRFILESRR
jgi:hypothetical protein